MRNLFKIRGSQLWVTFRNILYIHICVFLSGFLYVNLNTTQSQMPQNDAYDRIWFKQDIPETPMLPKLSQTFHDSREQKEVSYKHTNSTGGFVRAVLTKNSSLESLLGDLGKKQKNVVVKPKAAKESFANESKRKSDKGLSNGNKNSHDGKVMNKQRESLKTGKAPSNDTLIPFLKAMEKYIVKVCDGHFIGYSGSLVLLKEVTVIKSLAIANARGEEDILSVKDRPGESENDRFKPRFILLPCKEHVNKTFFKPEKHKGYIAPWNRSLLFETSWKSSPKGIPFDPSHENDHRFTVAITRYEYASLYWTLVDIYDVFLTISYFGKIPEKTHVILVDAKPWSHMWRTFFGSVSQLAEVPMKVTYDNLVWSFQRVHSPMLRRQLLPLRIDFRSKIFRAFNMSVPPENRYKKNCSSINQKLNVLFVWRRNYIAHPRNPSGIVSRKIANEKELLEGTIKAFPNYSIRGEQLDKLSMHEQVQIISKTDIMIGMHGAAFAFAWFLPEGSGAIEMFPVNQGANWHMQHIAESNEVHYITWKNKNPKNEHFHSKSTVIPPETAIQLIRTMTNAICLGVKIKPNRVDNKKKNQKKHQGKSVSNPKHLPKKKKNL